MKRSFNSSVAQMALLSTLGGLIVACGSLVLLPTWHHEHGWTILSQFAISCALILLSVYISYMANSNLTDGILNDHWKQEDVDNLRAFFQSRWTKGLNLILLLGFAILGLPWFHPQLHYQLIGWAFYLPGLNLILLSSAARRQPGTANHQPSWSNLSPIRSEHWGEHQGRMHP